MLLEILILENNILQVETPLGMVLVFQKLVFLSNFSKSIRQLKNAKKNCWQKFFAFLNMY